ncbi:MAG: serine/threonine protein kinase [Kofleriaceae bacterium]
MSAPRAIAKGRPKDPIAETLPPGHRVGAWKIVGELGRGGMGAVYAVTHNGFGKRAALKVCHASVLRTELSAETFLREARVVHLIDHPGVCDVFATGTFSGRPYLAMERLYGQTLGHLAHRRLVGRDRALELLIELCDILGAAHRAGVVHRDLKLDNVFVLDRPGAGGYQIKLVDWGVAHVIGEPDPLQGMIVGTLTYVAPEQARGDQITPSADIYSLGVLAYQLLFRQPPFSSTDDVQLIQKHLSAPPPSPTELWPEIPAELAALLLSMLAKFPEQRPSLAEVEYVLRHARLQTRPRRPTPPAPLWLERLTTVKQFDVLGRPVLGFATRPRLLGATVTLACAIACIFSLFGV